MAPVMKVTYEAQNMVEITTFENGQGSSHTVIHSAWHRLYVFIDEYIYIFFFLYI